MKKLLTFLAAVLSAMLVQAQPTPAQGVGRIVAGTNITLTPTSGTGGSVKIDATGGGGLGTVTTVSVATANGVSGTVATATTTPVITLTLGDITPSSISIGADPADAGDIRLVNAGIIGWEASPAGTDVTLSVNSSEQFVFSNSILSPTLITPALGVATATSLNGNFFTAGSSTYTGTAGQTYTFPTTSATVARTDAGNTFTGVSTATNWTLAGYTLTGVSVASPTVMPGTSIDVTLPKLTRALTGPETWTFSATPATGAIVTVVATADGTDRTVTLPLAGAVYSYDTQATVTSSVVSASTSKTFTFVREASRWAVYGNGVSTTGTGAYVLATSPQITTSLTTDSTTFALLNTTATTVNAFGAATTVNTGASATQIWNFGGSTTASEFRFLEPSGSGTNYSAFKAVAQGSNITYSLPPTVSAAGGALTDVAGNGVLTWVVPSGGVSLAGNNTWTGTNAFQKLVSFGATQSATAWTTTGVGFNEPAASYTDTTSSGTVAQQTINNIAAPTLLASSATTYTDSETFRIAGPPVASTNVTQTRPHSVVIQDVTSAGTDGLTGAVFIGTPGTASTAVSIGAGNITMGQSLTVGASGFNSWAGRVAMQSPADGILQLSNSAGTGFTRADFGGTTNSSPAIGVDTVNGFTLQSAAGTATWNDSATANSGTVANRYLWGVAAPTLSSTGTGVTDTVASTFYIGGAPTAGTNTTITKAHALLVAGDIISNSSTGGIGYKTGAGGAVTQATSRSTGVTLNTVTGTITTNNTSLAALTRAQFTVTDSAVALRDTVVLSVVSGPTADTSIYVVTGVAAGSFNITAANQNATTADTGAAIINFAVIKGSNN